MPPKLSVLIPSFNHARYLPEALDSILEQRFDDWELWIVDDASTDGSREVIERYAARDRRIRFRFNPANRGMVRSCNDCLALATGEYVKLVFGDDKLADPGAVGRMVELLDRRPGVRLVACARRLIDERSRPLGVRRYRRRDAILPGRRVIRDCLLRIRNLIGEPSAVLFRRADAARGFDPRYRQLVDLEMWLHLLERGDLAYLARPGCAFRRHALQETERSRAERVGELEHHRLLAKYLDHDVLAGARLGPVLFDHAYRLARRRDRDAELERLLAELRARLGRRYALHYARHKLTRPLSNLAGSLARRRARPRPAG
jgi:glycosyltransferase involved in cell wall biosynthesis